MRALPGGTLTFLFTDVEGSTRLWERFPEPMRAALVTHDAIVEFLAEMHGGHVVRPRGEGDSRFCVFPRPQDAVAAAVAMQRALFAEAWPPETALRVRMALHTGDADLRDGDYYGAAVNRCARLRGAAHGGQTLVSQETTSLVAHALPDGVTLRDLGERQLKDLIRPERVFQLVVPGLPASFPPLLTLDVRPHNLPPQLTPLVGREREIAAVRHLLLSPDVRLVTLTGPGGTGKTRLAVQVGAEVVDEFDHGVFFVALAPIADPALVPAAIADALGVREAAGRSVLDSVKDHLREKRLLLILDNYEQVLGAGPAVAELLAACPQIKALVTSRAVLRLYAEREYPVPPLTLPDRRHLPGKEQVLDYEAARLFVERAKAARPSFVVTDENAAAIVEICHRVDGLPLGVELAAARARLLSPAALLARLERRLPLLTGGARDLPARQQTLRGAIAWSYDLLPPEEQRLFRQLSVFSGGCALEAAAVCAGAALAGGEPDVATIDALELLVEKSLVKREGEESGARLMMLETIREYASEQLQACGETAATRRRHAEYFAARAEAADAELRGAEQLAWLRWLEGEHDNLRAALSYCAAAGEDALLLRLATALRWFWLVRAPSEGRSWLERALAPERATADHAAGRIAALLALVDLAWAARAPDLLTLLDELETACRAAGDEYGLARVQLVVGERASVFGDFARSQTLLEASVAAFHAQGAGWDEARARLELAADTERREERGRARSLLETCLALFRRLGDRWGIAQALFDLALDALVSGNAADAATLAEESLGPARELGDVRSTAKALAMLAVVALMQGDAAAAQSRLTEAAALGRDTGNQYAVARVLNIYGERFRAHGDHAWAALLYEQSLALFQEIGEDQAVASVSQNLGHAVLRSGDAERAAALFRASLTRSYVRYVPAHLVGMAGVALALGDGPRAVRLLAAASADLEKRGVTLEHADWTEYQHHLARARRQLDAATFHAAWVGGVALPLDAAVAEALALPSAPASCPPALP